MILKIGKGTFDVRPTPSLLAAWICWAIWPSYPNLQRVTRKLKILGAVVVLSDGRRIQIP